VLLDLVCLPFFLIVLLILSLQLLARDAKAMIIDPINRIVRMVQKLARDPLGDIGSASDDNRSGRE
jgi:hypothetical protein